METPHGPKRFNLNKYKILRQSFCPIRPELGANWAERLAQDFILIQIESLWPMRCFHVVNPWSVEFVSE